MKNRKITSTLTLPRADVKQAILAYIGREKIKIPEGELTSVDAEMSYSSLGPESTGGLVLTWVEKV